MLTALVMPVRDASLVDLVQGGLQDTGRLLMMIAMVLFLTYALFMLGAVLLSATAGRVRSVRRRHSAGALGSSSPVSRPVAELRRLSA